MNTSCHYAELERKETDNEWVIGFYTSNKKLIRKVIIEFSIKENIISKGYQVTHPVDYACDEPDCSKLDVEIKDDVYLLFLDKDGDEDVESYELTPEEYSKSIELIKNSYEF